MGGGVNRFLLGAVGHGGGALFFSFVSFLHSFTLVLGFGGLGGFFLDQNLRRIDSLGIFA